MNIQLLQASFLSLVSLSTALSQAPLGHPDATAAFVLGAGGHGRYAQGDEVIAIGPDYKASFRSGGVTFTPALGDRVSESAPVHLELASIRRGEHVLIDADGSTRPALDGDFVYYDHGRGIQERYETRRDHIHQTFRFAQRPLGHGDLVVRLRMTTRLPIRPGQDGGLSCRFDGIGGVTIGGVTGVDARGVSTPGNLRVAGEHLELVLPGWFVDQAALPLLLDPVIGAKIDFTTGSSGAPAVAYSSGYYVVVWEQRYSATSVDIVAQRVSTGGTLGPIAVIYNAPSWAIKPRIASLKGPSPRFLVVWEEDATLSFTRIRGCTVDLTITASAAVTIAGGASLELVHNPDVGGDRTGTDTYAMVVWEEESLGIRGRRVFVPNLPGTPAVFSALPEFAVESNTTGAEPTTHTEPAISKSAGDVGRYLVVWRKEGSGNASIRARLMDSVGTLIDSGSTQVSESLLALTDHRNPDCDGDGDNFIAAWQRAETQGGSEYDIYARPVSHRSGFLVTESVQPIAIVANRDEVDPAVAYAGYQTMIAYGREVLPSGLYHIVLTSVDPLLGLVGHGPQQLSDTASTFGSIDIASTWDGDAGVQPPHDAMITWQLSSVVRGRIFESPSDAVSLGGSVGSGGDTFAPCAFAGNGNFTLHLRDGAPNMPVVLVLSLSATATPWGTGTLWPSSGFVLLIGATDGAGNAEQNLSLPAGISGTLLVAQWAIADGLGFLGFSLSDGIQVTIQNP